jgi:muconolactone delta-isomerase
LKYLISLPLIALSVSLHAQSDFRPLFDEKLSNAVFPAGIWTVQDGVLTASEDQAVWTSKVYQNFELELEFMTAPGTNSGVIIYCSDIKNWIPNSVEVQIADDFAEQWAKSAKTWQCGAIFGRLAPTKSAVKKPGEWNTYKIMAVDRVITVVLNGETVSTMDMRKWTEVKANPDGSEIPSWLSTPAAKLPGYGHIGLQGKHAGAPIYFRNLRIKEL